MPGASQSWHKQECKRVSRRSLFQTTDPQGRLRPAQKDATVVSPHGLQGSFQPRLAPFSLHHPHEATPLGGTGAPGPPPQKALWGTKPTPVSTPESRQQPISHVNCSSQKSQDKRSDSAPRLRRTRFLSTQFLASTPHAAAASKFPLPLRSCGGGEWVSGVKEKEVPGQRVGASSLSPASPPDLLPRACGGR